MKQLRRNRYKLPSRQYRLRIQAQKNFLGQGLSLAVKFLPHILVPEEKIGDKAASFMTLDEMCSRFTVRKIQKRKSLRKYIRYKHCHISAQNIEHLEAFFS